MIPYPSAALGLSVVLLQALPATISGQTYLSLMLGYNLTNRTFVESRVTDPFGSVTYTNYQPDGSKYLIGGGGVQFGARWLAVRLTGAYGQAGEFDPLRDAVITCAPGTTCIKRLLLPVRIASADLDFIVRPWRPDVGRYITPYILLGPTATYRLPSEKLRKARSLERDAGTLVASLAAGAGLQFNFWQPATRVLPLSMFLEGRYADVTGSLFPRTPIDAGDGSVQLGSPYRASRWSLRTGMMLNFTPSHYTRE